MIRIYKVIISVLKILLVIFIVIGFIDLLKFLNGTNTILSHLHHNIIDAFLVSIIILIIYIIVLYVEIISERHWKKVISITISLISVLTVCFIFLDRYSDKANLNAYKYVELAFAGETPDMHVRCEENTKRNYDFF